jgi:hypothetical protein
MFRAGLRTGPAAASRLSFRFDYEEVTPGVRSSVPARFEGKFGRARRPQGGEATIREKGHGERVQGTIPFSRDKERARHA